MRIVVRCFLSPILDEQVFDQPLPASPKCRIGTGLKCDPIGDPM